MKALASPHRAAYYDSDSHSGARRRRFTEPPSAPAARRAGLIRPPHNPAHMRRRASPSRSGPGLVTPATAPAVRAGLSGLLLLGAVWSGACATVEEAAVEAAPLSVQVEVRGDTAEVFVVPLLAWQRFEARVSGPESARRLLRGHRIGVIGSGETRDGNAYEGENVLVWICGDRVHTDSTYLDRTDPRPLIVVCP